MHFVLSAMRKITWGLVLISPTWFAHVCKYDFYHHSTFGFYFRSVRLTQSHAIIIWNVPIIAPLLRRFSHRTGLPRRLTTNSRVVCTCILFFIKETPQTNELLYLLLRLHDDQNQIWITKSSRVWSISPLQRLLWKSALYNFCQSIAIREIHSVSECSLGLDT